MAAEPSAQERVTAKATPAEAMAWTKADSRVAAEEGDEGYGGQVRRAAVQKAGIQKPGLRKENSVHTGSTIVLLGVF